MNDEAYSQLAALNWSTLKHMATSPKLCAYRAHRPEPDKDSYRIGRLIHVACIEPERWATDFVCEPDFGPQVTSKGDPAKNPKGTNGYKAALAEWRASLPQTAVVVDAEEHTLATRCAEAVYTHRIAGRLLTGGRAEHAIQWTDPATGTACKGRLDYVPDAVIDLKSTHRQTVQRFEWDVADYLYHGQVAWYHDGAIEAGALPRACDGPYIIAVQTCEPYDVMVFFVPPSAVDAGRNLYRELLQKYLQCQDAQWWPGIAPDLLTLNLPARARGAFPDLEEGASF